MIEPLIHTNYCALCGKSINQDKTYYCLSMVATSEHNKQIHMGQPKYGYFCIDCADKLIHLFSEDNSEITI